MSITDEVSQKPHIETQTNILNLQKLAINMASFGAKKRIDIWHDDVDEFTLDYLSAYFGTSIDKEINLLIIRSNESDIYVQLKK